jgi:signal transduction histidine kinase
VRSTLATVTERLQQILKTVRRDPTHTEMTRLDLNNFIRDTEQTWAEMARDKWKLNIKTDLGPGPLIIEADLSHLQQAIENLIFNARDATFEMRNHLRQSAYKDYPPHSPELRQCLITAAAWKGEITIRTHEQDEYVILELQDNGIGMTDDVRQQCTQTHFSTKRNNALYEGYSAGMGLGLSFVIVILEHHHAILEIESTPLNGALFRAKFPKAREG